jgi:hypothetical protein
MRSCAAAVSKTGEQTAAAEGPGPPATPSSAPAAVPIPTRRAVRAFVPCSRGGDSTAQAAPTARAEEEERVRRGGARLVGAEAEDRVAAARDTGKESASA